MADPSTPDLPAEVLQLIFSAQQPAGSQATELQPVLTVEERLRCQLVSKAWRHALHPQRWPLHSMKIEALGGPTQPPPGALWLHHTKPALEQLEIDLDKAGKERISTGCGELWVEKHPLDLASPAVVSTHEALLALQPCSALCSLSLWAPFFLLERFLPDLGRCFGGLKQLRLRAHSRPYSYDPEDYWHEHDAVLGRSLLHQLPPCLESLKLARFYAVRFEAPEPAGSTQTSEPPALLPSLTQLEIASTCAVVLDAPLPALAHLTVMCCRDVSLEGERLSLPQLTSLALIETSAEVSLRCGAMPALAHMVCDGSNFDCCDSPSALHQLTQLNVEFGEVEGDLENNMAFVAGVAATLCSLCLDVVPSLAPEAASLLAAAGATSLTHLDFSSPSCLPHLPAWPRLQHLVVREVHPTSITADELVLLAAATSLRRLELTYAAANVAGSHAEAERMEEMRRTLPQCTVAELGA